MSNLLCRIARDTGSKKLFLYAKRFEISKKYKSWDENFITPEVPDDYKLVRYDLGKAYDHLSWTQKIPTYGIICVSNPFAWVEVEILGNGVVDFVKPKLDSNGEILIQRE